MDPLFERVFDLLLELGWTFWLPVSAGHQSLMMLAEGRYASWHCRIESVEDDQHLLVEVALPVHVPAARVQAVEEYVVRASALIAIGGFTFDREAGVVAFKHTLDVADQPLTLDRFRRFAERAVMTADEHLPGLMAVTFASSRPLDALGLVCRFPVDAVVHRANDMLWG